MSSNQPYVFRALQICLASALVAFINGKNCPQPQASSACGSKNFQNSYHKLCQYVNNSEDRFLTNLIIRSANLLKVSAVVTTWEFTISEKSRISAYFLRVDVRYGVDRRFLTVISYCGISTAFFRKTFRLPTISILTTSAQRDKITLLILIC